MLICGDFIEESRRAQKFQKLKGCKHKKDSLPLKLFAEWDD